MGGEISKLRVSFPLTSWQNPSLSFSPTHPLRLSWVTCPRCGSCDSSQSPRGTMPLGLWERCRRDRGRMNAWLIWPDWFLREIRGKLPSAVLPAGSASTCFQFCAILASAPGGFSGGRAHPPGRRRLLLRFSNLGSMHVYFLKHNVCLSFEILKTKIITCF